MARNKIAPDAKSLMNEDSTTDELFSSLVPVEKLNAPQHSMSFVPSFFTTASLPFKNVNKTVFVRKGSQGVTLTLTSPKNVPFGKHGRLLLSILTTHAVLSKNKNCPVLIEYNSLSQLLQELQLPKQRGTDIKEQLECFKNATFCFEQKVSTLKSAYLFEELYNEPFPKKDVVVETVTSGTIPFTTAVQFQNIPDQKNGSWVGEFKILLSAEFASFCQQHAVPIDYTVYKEISSAAGKDIYAWLVFRNNGLKEGKPIFISRDKLVEQFLPIEDSNDRKAISGNYARIVDEIRKIKEKHYPELKVDLSDPAGITLYKSPTPILKDDKRYALITSNI